MVESEKSVYNRPRSDHISEQVSMRGCLFQTFASREGFLDVTHDPSCNLTRILVKYLRKGNIYVEK